MFMFCIHHVFCVDAVITCHRSLLCSSHNQTRSHWEEKAQQNIVSESQCSVFHKTGVKTHKARGNRSVSRVYQLKI